MVGELQASSYKLQAAASLRLKKACGFKPIGYRTFTLEAKKSLRLVA